MYLSCFPPVFPDTRPPARTRLHRHTRAPALVLARSKHIRRARSRLSFHSHAQSCVFRDIIIFFFTPRFWIIWIWWKQDENKKRECESSVFREQIPLAQSRESLILLPHIVSCSWFEAFESLNWLQHSSGQESFFSISGAFVELKRVSIEKEKKSSSEIFPSAFYHF